MKIGFIGLGNMGAPMAANLVAAGHEVTGFDLAARPEGVAPAASAAEAAKGAEVVITMLPNGEILRSVAAEVIPAMAAARSSATARRSMSKRPRGGRRPRPRGSARSTRRSRAGSAARRRARSPSWSAAADAAFATVKPLFEVMGQKAVHCGGPGAGRRRRSATT
jgi:3-hydroxyisobutyrate dehydrogenase